MLENATYVILKPEDLEMLATRLADKLNSSRGCEKDEEALTAEEVCRLLKISPTSLWRREKEGVITPKYIGARKFYAKSQIRALLVGESKA